MNEQIRGVSFPFHINPASGSVRMTSGDEKLKENILHLLQTAIGERIMNRDYGAGLRQLLHDPNNDALKAIVQHQIGKSIGQLEPRVALQSIDVEQEGATLLISVQYLVRRTGQVQQVSVPLAFGGV
jgi:uncharacterized protein